jgi:integral membrane protein (TIGR01906 family)
MITNTPRYFERALSIMIALIIPPLLVMIGVRLAMTMTFVSFEYHRPNFPFDFYGFTLEDRLNYAPYALDYLLNGEDIDFLGDLTFPGGSPLFNDRELRHMQDVKVITEWAYRAAVGLGVVLIAASVILWRRGRWHLRSGIRAGGLLTLALIILIIVLAFVSWDVFFTAFHQAFFEGDSWLFLTSDTLIRLFPEQFWFDAAIFIGGVAAIGALMLVVFAQRWKPERNI